MPNPNEILQDDAIRHEIFNLRLRSYERNQIGGLLDQDVYRDVTAMLRDTVPGLPRIGGPRGPISPRRIAELERGIFDATRDGLTGAFGIFDSHLGTIGSSEVDWQVARLRDVLPGVTVGIPSAGSIGALGSIQIQGRPLTAWWRGVDESLRRNVIQTIQAGAAAGMTNAEIMAKLASPGGPVATSKRNIDALIRTAVAQTTNEAKLLVFQENPHLIKGWRFVATLDDRTTLICIGLHGKIFELSDTRYVPPRHFRCRSTTAPVLRGVRVPAVPSYGGFLRNQSRAFQDDVLGPARAALFRAGKVPVERFTEDFSRVLSLDELRAREGLPAL